MYSSLNKTWGQGPETIKTEPINCRSFPWPNCNNNGLNINSWICSMTENGENFCKPSSKPPSIPGSSDQPFRYSTREECQRSCNNQPPVGQFSFRCVGSKNGNNTCILENRPQGEGSFSNLQECQRSCNNQPPVGQFSFKCATAKDGSKRCFQVNEGPNESEGRYTTPQACMKACTQSFSFICRETSTSAGRICI